MGNNLKLLVLEPEEPPRDRRLGLRAERARALGTIASSGAKVRHDSGGRLIVIDVPEEAEKALTARMTGARLVPLDADVKIADPDSTESLFLDALRIRTSRSYRDAKARRKVGETPEEQELVSAPDVREEY